jgi:hypothetical protein
VRLLGKTDMAIAEMPNITIHLSRHPRLSCIGTTSCGQVMVSVVPCKELCLNLAIDSRLN